MSVFYDGRVVLIRRVDADFRELFDMGNFPFDRQHLLFTFAPRRLVSSCLAVAKVWHCAACRKMLMCLETKEDVSWKLFR